MITLIPPNEQALLTYNSSKTFFELLTSLVNLKKPKATKIYKLHKHLYIYTLRLYILSLHNIHTEYT